MWRGHPPCRGIVLYVGGHSLCGEIILCVEGSFSMFLSSCHAYFLRKCTRQTAIGARTSNITLKKMMIASQWYHSNRKPA